MLQRERARKAGGTAGGAGEISRNASEKYSQFWQLWSEKTLVVHLHEGWHAALCQWDQREPGLAQSVGQASGKISVWLLQLLLPCLETFPQAWTESN